MRCMCYLAKTTEGGKESSAEVVESEVSEVGEGANECEEGLK